MMLMAASWPSNRLAAVTKRTLCVGRYSARALNSADRSVMSASVGTANTVSVVVSSCLRGAGSRGRTGCGAGFHPAV
jgi:hypothetical protein